MADKSKQLAVSGYPHIHVKRDTASIMGDVIIGLLPALGFAVWMFGVKSMWLALTCVAGCVAFEWLFRRATGRSSTVGDRSAIVTGLILSFTLPAALPLWMALIGCFIAIIVVKQLFGGLGGNFANPALTASLALSVTFSVRMNTWPITEKMASTITDTGAATEAVSGATPLFLLKQDLGALPSVTDLLLGRVSGGMGEICALALLIGGIWLIARRVICPLVPLGFLGSTALVAFLYGRDPLYDIFAGATMLTAFFMATDPVTSPVRPVGRAIFGIGCGLLTMFIRIYSVFPDGALFAVLLMELLVPYIDRLTRVRLPRAARKGGSDEG